MGMLGLHLVLILVSSVVAAVAFGADADRWGYGALGFAAATVIVLIPRVLAAIARRQGATNLHGAIGLIRRAPAELAQHAQNAAVETARGPALQVHDRSSRAIAQSVGRVTTSTRRDLAATAGELARTMDRQLDAQSVSLVDDIVAVQLLLARHPLSGPAPERRPGGLSPWHASRAIALMDRTGAKRVLGIDLGESAVWLGLHAQRSGVELTLLESSALDGDRLRSFLSLHDVSADVLTPDLTATGILHHYAPWFDVSALPGDPPWDLVVVGLPATGGRDLLPIVPLLADRLSGGAVVVAAAADEGEARHVFERWSETHDVTIDRLNSSASLTVLTVP